MKCRIERAGQSGRIPEAGECYMHRLEKRVFMRIPDTTGRVVLPRAPEGAFFGLSLGPGTVHYTRPETDDIICLAPRDGVMVFVPKEEGE